MVSGDKYPVSKLRHPAIWKCHNCRKYFVGGNDRRFCKICGSDNIDKVHTGGDINGYILSH